MQQHIAARIEESVRDHACEDGLRPPGDEPDDQSGQHDAEEPGSERFGLKIIHMPQGKEERDRSSSIAGRHQTGMPNIRNLCRSLGVGLRPRREWTPEILMYGNVYR